MKAGKEFLLHSVIQRNLRLLKALALPAPRYSSPKGHLGISSGSPGHFFTAYVSCDSGDTHFLFNGDREEDLWLF